MFFYLVDMIKCFLSMFEDFNCWWVTNLHVICERTWMLWWINVYFQNGRHLSDHVCFDKNQFALYELHTSVCSTYDLKQLMNIVYLLTLTAFKIWSDVFFNMQGKRIFSTKKEYFKSKMLCKVIINNYSKLLV